MPILQFPDPRETDSEGILGVGGDLHPDSLQLAYRQGIFPWPIDGIGLVWFCPDPRAILEFSKVHISRSLRKALKKMAFHATVDRAFGEVITGCAEQPRRDQEGTWITPALKAAYVRFHQMGHAHSVEIWQGKKLVGGLYGVALEGIFSAESMFHRVPNASKLALLHLVEHLKSRGLDWLDIQVMTPHLRQLGAREISRNEYLQRLRQTQRKKLDLFP